jgi:serine/threonine-protein kinase
VPEAELIDDYELINCIATGNATQIWEVRPQGNAQSQAMKILLPEAFKEAEQKKALKHEANVGKLLEHPNIIRILDFKMNRKHGYFVMEYFRGGNLKSLIRSDRPFVQAKAKKIIECLSQALAFMHDKNWLHKDVKPDNVMVTKGGEVRLIDFSLASRPGNMVAHALTKKANVVIQGTRTYLAPELIRRELLTASADIYSLGVLFFEILTGVPPFRTANPNDLLIMHVRDQPPPPSMLDSNISPEADKLVLKLLAKHPKQRPASMHEVFAEVRNLQLFNEDPIVHARNKHEAMMSSDAQAQEDRLNSRLDAERTASGTVRPAAPKPKPKPAPPIEKEKPKAPAAPAAQAPPQQPQAPYGYPGMGYPGMPMPGYPGAPGMPMPGYPGMPMPGFPGQPGMPMQGYPGMPMPGFPNQPGMPMPGYPGMPMPGFPGQPGMMPMPQAPGQPAPGAASGPQPAPPRPTPQAVPPRPSAPIPSAPKPSAPASPPSEEIASIDDLDIE